MMLPFFEWMQNLRFSMFFLENTWASPIIQCMHLTSLCVFSGAILVVDIRLLGRGLVNTPLAQLGRAAQPWMIWGFLALLATGLPSVGSTALKQYYSPFFWWKMNLVIVGLVFTFTIRRKIVMAAEGQFGSIWPKVVGLASITIWMMVAIWARLIGLLS